MVFSRVAFPPSQFPAIMKPVLDSIDAISQECQSALEAMPADPSPEHYPVLEVRGSFASIFRHCYC